MSIKTYPLFLLSCVMFISFLPDQKETEPKKKVTGSRKKAKN